MVPQIVIIMPSHSNNIILYSLLNYARMYESMLFCSGWILQLGPLTTNDRLPKAPSSHTSYRPAA